MTYWSAILLGIIQGLAEFLPISSSGHLAILQNFLRIGDLENQMRSFWRIIRSCAGCAARGLPCSTSKSCGAA